MNHPTKVITGPRTVFSYLTVNEPRIPLRGGKPRYSASLIIPKDDTKTVEKIRAAIRTAYDEGLSLLKGKSEYVPPLTDLKTPLRDGDRERPDQEAYRGAWFINANSTTKPGVVDADCQPILRTDELYSGIIGRASISFYAFNVDGNRGIACGLNNIQKLMDGRPLGGRPRAEEDFAGLDDDDDDDDYLD